MISEKTAGHRPFLYTRDVLPCSPVLFSRCESLAHSWGEYRFVTEGGCRAMNRIRELRALALCHRGLAMREHRLSCALVIGQGADLFHSIRRLAARWMRVFAYMLADVPFAT